MTESNAHDIDALWSRLALMSDEIVGADAVYRPSVLWTHLNALNLEQLKRLGLENFKQTVNQNYFNWLPKAFSDNQVRRVLLTWLRQPTLRPLFATIEPPSALEGFSHARALDTWSTRTIYRLFVTLLWEYARREDRLEILEQLDEPTLGNPIRIRYRGRLISQDVANSVREANRLVPFLLGLESRPIIAELGAGYGRLGFALLQGLPCRYWVFDIPPALLIAEWYLACIFLSAFADFSVSSVSRVCERARRAGTM